ncbi:MAG: phenylalanine--tRNA ligase subunit beta, partial [Candidatus Eremiobacteraeota bacterium]|nr:phenylalanine--tRNA ligase subunit beta [Candidatus Eremiobacteraeota bacterium]
VLGRIRQIENHPNADRLQLCKVEIGNGEILDLITAATNVKPGDSVPVAIVGANLAGRKKIKKSKIRGVESLGMLCSSNELGIDGGDLPVEQREGVMILGQDLPPGTDLVKEFLLNEQVLVIETFANRPDMLSILGIAREISAMLNKPLKFPDTSFPEEEKCASEYIDVKIEDFKLCPRYMARIITGLKIGPTPAWMASRLRLSGIRSINNVVDITNYVMLEYGQPFHAFDYDLLRGKTIIVRPARKGEELVTIDETKISMEPDMLVIADKAGPIALAGVMGGLNTEVNQDTTKILLEIANFHPASIRRTSVNMGMRSESSLRFEKGLDYFTVPKAAERACHLFSKIGGKIAKGAVDVAGQEPKKVIVDIRPKRASSILGIPVGKRKCKGILSSLGMDVEEKGDSISVVVPSFRPDITREEDLIEEIARCIGYDRIPITMPYGITLQGRQGEKEEFLEWIADLMRATDLFEIITPALHPGADFELFNLTRKGSMKVLNPLIEDQAWTRNSLLPGMLKAIKANMTPNWERLGFFEITNIYLQDRPESFPREKIMLGIIIASSKNEIDFRHIKGYVELIFRELQLDVEFRPVIFPWFHPGISAEIYFGKTHLGHLGRVHPEICQRMDIEVPVFFTRLNLDHIRKLAKKRFFKPISRFPAISRDLAFIIDEEQFCSDITREIKKAGGDLLATVVCFDQYTGKQIPKGKKSLAFHLVFSADNRTLTDDEVDDLISNVKSHLSEKFEAKLRGV